MQSSSTGDVYVLYLLEKIKQLLARNSVIIIKITYLKNFCKLLNTLRRTQAHLQTQVTVGKKQLLTLQEARLVSVVPLEDSIYVAFQKLVVHVSIPSSGVVDSCESFESLIVVVRDGPPVEWVTLQLS